MVGPFWPMLVGMAKQFGLMYWCSRGSSRVTGQDRVERDIRRAQQRHVADVEGGARDLVAVEVHAEVLAAVGPERFAPLWICAMPESCQPFTKPPASLLLDGVAQLEGVGGVEDVRAVVGQHAIVVGEVELVEDVPLRPRIPIALP